MVVEIDSVKLGSRLRTCRCVIAHALITCRCVIAHALIRYSVLCSVESCVVDLNFLSILF